MPAGDAGKRCVDECYQIHSSVLKGYHFTSIEENIKNKLPVSIFYSHSLFFIFFELDVTAN